jgi:hypothetical protein
VSCSKKILNSVKYNDAKLKLSSGDVVISWNELRNTSNGKLKKKVAKKMKKMCTECKPSSYAKAGEANLPSLASQQENAGLPLVLRSKPSPREQAPSQQPQPQQQTNERGHIIPRRRGNEPTAP